MSATCCCSAFHSALSQILPAPPSPPLAADVVEEEAILTDECLLVQSFQKQSVGIAVNIQTFHTMYVSQV